MDFSKINNLLISRSNLSCSYYGDIQTNCEYCVYQYYSNGTASISTYDCIRITNTYQSQSKQCEGFSNTRDIGYGICSPLSFELFDLSILCICATNMCNTNFTTCRSSVNDQIQSNTVPSVLPSIISDLSKTILCTDQSIPLMDSSTASYYCVYSTSPYINMTKCNEYTISKTVLCVYIKNDDNILSSALTEDSYRMFLSNIITVNNIFSNDSSVQEYANESSAYFYLNWNRTDGNQSSIFERCFCAQDNCNTNLTNCFNANVSISITNNGTKIGKNIFASLCLNLIITMLLALMLRK